MKRGIMVGSITLLLVVFAVGAQGGDKEVKQEKENSGEVSQNIEYRPIPLVYANNDPELKAMIHRLNTLSLAVSQGNLMKMNSMVQEIYKRLSSEETPLVPHVEIQMTIKANRLVSVDITDQKADVYFKINLGSNGFPTSFEECLGDRNVLPKLQIRNDGKPKMLATFTMKDGQIKRRGRYVLWDEDGNIKSDKVLHKPQPIYLRKGSKDEDD